MIDGTYTVTAKTPLGTKKGTVDLRSSGSADNEQLLSVTLHVTGFRFAINHATYIGDTFEVEGRVSHLLGSLPFTCKGTVEGDRLSATAFSNGLSLQFDGVRI